MRIIKITLDDILSLITCARDFGFEDDVLFNAFSTMMNGKLTDEEIDSHLKIIEFMNEYDEEDYEIIKERLKNFKNKYCN